MNIFQYIQRKWDWQVYRWAYKSFKRFAKSNPGFTYLFELQLRDWNKANPISEDLKDATETFHNSFKL